MMHVPKSLRNWFLVHFVLDFAFGIPLILVPEKLLSIFDFTSVETFTARLVGAALIGIGGASLWVHKGNKEQFLSMLELKLLWSGTGLVAILISYSAGSPALASLLFFSIFLIFFFVWLYYYKKLK